MAVEVVRLWESGLDTVAIAQMVRASGGREDEAEIERIVNRHIDRKCALRAFGNRFSVGGEYPCRD